MSYDLVHVNQMSALFSYFVSTESITYTYLVLVLRYYYSTSTKYAKPLVLRLFLLNQILEIPYCTNL